MSIDSYKYQAELMVMSLKDYLQSEALIPCTSVLLGILMSKMAYDFMNVSSFCYKGYASLSKLQKVEWKNRGMSTVHAIFITSMALYLVFISDLFSDRLVGPVTFRSSNLSTFTLGVSVGYFLTDLAMIFWLYPKLGGMEYVLHHMLSIVSLAYAMLLREGQLFIYMTLISETTTPSINLRWYLDTAGKKKSKVYLVNGVAMFVAWMVARIILFMYLFYHIYLHFNQIKMMHKFGYCLMFMVPAIISVMNLLWFGKILRGLKKTLANKRE
ncbi:hypothetical protein LUZ60_010375 [Juncus effusus]|nr:hypothetical protein LUZ60_010375 [Juncus effusus]